MPHAAVGARLAAASFLATLYACSPPQSTLLLWIATDVPAGQLRNLRVRCGYDWDGTGDPATPACDLSLASDASCTGLALPASLAIVADPARVRAPITIVFDDGTPTSLLRRTLRTHFVEGQTLRVQVFLADSCLTTSSASAHFPCPAAQASCTVSESCEQQLAMTCGNDGLCRSIDLVPDETTLGDAGTLRSGPLDACP